MPLFDHFALLAPVYDRVFGTKVKQRLLDLLDLSDGDVLWLLDAGGGTGRITNSLGQTGQRALIDVSSRMVARAGGKAGINAACARVQHAPFADNTFDRIMVVDAWHHFDDQLGAARDLVRVLKPGGRMVVEDFNVSRRSVKFMAAGEKLALMGSHFLTPERLAAQFAPIAGARVTLHPDHRVLYWAVVEKEAL